MTRRELGKAFSAFPDNAYAEYLLNPSAKTEVIENYARCNIISQDSDQRGTSRR